MIKLRSKDVYMQDISFERDLSIREESEKQSMFDTLMDSVCDLGGKCLSKEERTSVKTKFDRECKIFKRYMEELKVKPIRKEK